MSQIRNIKNIQFNDALEQRYLAYALSTIMSRSLPDVRDGLKPVHRRILYAMLQLKLDPKTGYKKCARIVGDVLGKYHPHGDGAAYDALVRMAQFFSTRYPTVDGQGNFGSIDGDGPASMRYTEAKLTPYAMHLLESIDQDTVDFRPNYDGTDDEPVVLPAYVPNLLANGTEGIAVGMATSIPPHNIVELCDAVILLLKKPDATVVEIMKFVKCPDFPTGGLLIEPYESMVKTYETGRGSFRLRAKWHKEELERGQYRIIITEIPYQVQKKGLIEKLADLYVCKKLPFLETFSDQSAEDLKIVILPKNRNIDADLIMEHLFKLSDLEVKIQLNMNVLDARSVPEVMSLRQVLNAFIEHRIIIAQRKLKYRLKNINHRLEILQGMLIAFLNLDEVIRIIREEDDAKQIMMQKWNLTELQTEAILNTRLRSLRKLEEIQLQAEFDELSLEKISIEDILSSEATLKDLIISEVKKIKQFYEKSFLGTRKTSIGIATESIDLSLDSFIEKEPMTLILSDMGWLRSQKGHNLENIRYKEGDSPNFVVECSSVDKILFYTNSGRFFNTTLDKLSKGKGDGDPIRLTFDMQQEESILSVFAYNSKDKFLVSSNDGKGFIVNASDILGQTRNGKQVLTCKPFSALPCIKASGKWVITFGENRRLLVFNSREIPELRKGRGVVLQKFKQGKMSHIYMLENEEEFLKLMSSGPKDMKIWLGKRGGLGRLVLGKLWTDK